MAAWIARPGVREVSTLKPTRELRHVAEVPAQVECPGDRLVAEPVRPGHAIQARELADTGHDQPDGLAGQPAAQLLAVVEPDEQRAGLFSWPVSGFSRTLDDDGPLPTRIGRESPAT
jgi:hypothetical protein